MSTLTQFFGGGGAPKSQVFTSSSTWTRPAGVDVVYVTATGAGAAGGKSPAGTTGTAGGEGGQAGIRIPLSVSGNLTVTIGAGGDGASGTAGGSTSVGELVFLGGISSGVAQTRRTTPIVEGGAYSGKAYGGAGGTAPEAGQSGFGFSGGNFGGTSGSSAATGGGGAGLRGNGANGSSSGSGGSAGANTGAGGGGSRDSANGGNGGSGWALIEWFE